MEYAIKAAQFATEYKSKKLPHTEWSMIPRGPPPGVPDVCIFDFTNLYAARVAARVTVRYESWIDLLLENKVTFCFQEGSASARNNCW